MRKTFILFLAIFAMSASSKAQWSLTGNASTNPPTNFLGTTDQKPLVFKVNGALAGLLDYDGNKANASFGAYSLYSNSTGAYNTVIGYQGLYSNTSGYNNTASGIYSMVYNTEGAYNSAYGQASLFSNTTGNYNVAIGPGALSSNTTVSYLTAVGYRALYSNSSGTENTAVGYRSLYSNTSGSRNTASGYHALYTNTTGEYNTAYGSYALFNNTEGDVNTALGTDALRSNTTGLGNTATGAGALYDNETGGFNTANGDYALSNNYSGEGNTSVGAQALITIYSGSNNTAVGYYADINHDDYSNSGAFGAYALATASNQVRIGNSSVTSIGGSVGWTTFSDKRIKKNIQSDVPGLELINKLNPVTYNLDLGAMDRIVQLPAASSKDENVRKLYNNMVSSGKAKEEIRLTGFIAQEVEEAAKSIGFDFSAVDEAKNDKDLYGLRYAEFVVPLVKAVQELSSQNDNLKKENEQLQAQFDILSRRITALELTQENGEKVKLGIASLGQNAPNPFNNNTLIRYNIPLNTNNALITVTDIAGVTVKTIPLSTKGLGNVIVMAGALSAGTYTYSLIVDGKKVDTKLMILTK